MICKDSLDDLLQNLQYTLCLPLRNHNGQSRNACMYDTETVNVDTNGLAIRDDSFKSVYLVIEMLATELRQGLDVKGSSAPTPRRRRANGEAVANLPSTSEGVPWISSYSDSNLLHALRG